MKVFVCCEGVTDIGPITIFMQKCSPDRFVEVKCETHTSIRVKKIYTKKLSKYLSPDPDRFDRITYIKKLYMLAVLDNSSHIAYHQDTGHQRFKDVYNGIQNDFSDAVPNDDMHCLAIVPKEMIESWLLADEKAYHSVSGDLHLDPHPEDLWGDKHIFLSNYPKNYFARVLSRLGITNDRNAYTQIAEKCDIDTLKARCPKSFGQFLMDMQTFIPKEETE
jgi:hypothetical protein